MTEEIRASRLCESWTVFEVLLVGAAVYKAIHLVKAVLNYFKFNLPEGWPILASILFGCAVCLGLGLDDWWLLGFAAATVAGTLHILLRWLFHLGSKAETESFIELRRK
jgi:hypothetical protein